MECFIVSKRACISWEETFQITLRNGRVCSAQCPAVKANGVSYLELPLSDGHLVILIAFCEQLRLGMSLLDAMVDE